MLGRRNFIAMAGASAFSIMVPGGIAVANPLVVMAVKAAAGEAGKYVAGELLSSILGGQSSMPSTQDIINAIEASTEEIKKHVSKETRAAITEDRVRELQAACDSILGKLNDYARVRPEDRSGYLFLLENADITSRDAVALAARLGPPAFTPYSILVSLRIMVAKSFLDYNQKAYIYTNFAGELRRHIATMRSGIWAYRHTLDPNVRLTDFKCVSREDGGQLPIRWLVCTFKVDGELVNAMETSSPGGRFDAQITQQALGVQSQKLVELTDFMFKMDREFVTPLLDAADEWEIVASKIDHGPISINNGKVPHGNAPTGKSDLSIIDLGNGGTFGGDGPVKFPTSVMPDRDRQGDPIGLRW